MGKRIVLALLACLAAWSAHAAQLAGRALIEDTGYNAGPRTVEQVLGFKTSHVLAGELRLDLSRAFSRFRVEGAVQLSAHNGTAVQRNLTMARAFPLLALSSPDTDYWHLNRVFADGGQTRSTGRIDRLNVSWTGDHLVLRFGRQALTWGSGLVFHPMDLVNPFEPVATDTVYKRGTDMAYGQWLFDNGSDVQFAAVLRRRRDGATAGDAKNTYAVLANLAGGEFQSTLLIARNRSDDVAGLGTSHGVGSAVWNGEMIATRRQGGATVLSLLSNISWATVWHGDNVTLFAEYYRSGFGEAQSRYTAESLSPALLARLRRGESFVTGMDYLSLGATWGVTPLLQLMPTVIVNLRDRSQLIDLQAAWSVSDNTVIKGGIRVVGGGRGTEFKGLELAPGADLYLASPDQAFVRVAHYFQGAL